MEKTMNRPQISSSAMTNYKVPMRMAITTTANTTTGSISLLSIAHLLTAAAGIFK